MVGKIDWKDVIFWIVVVVFAVSMIYLFATGRAIK